MFDIGWPELVVIAIVVIVVVGPKDLPRALRAFGKTTGKMRKMAGEFRKQFDDALKEAELDEIRNLASEARKLDPTSEIRKNLDPMRKLGDEIKSGLEQSVKPAPPQAEPTGTAGQEAPATPGPAAGKVAAQAQQPPTPQPPTPQPEAPQPAVSDAADRPDAGKKSSGASS